MYEQTIREADLRLTIKTLRAQLKDFQSGEKYLKMKKQHRRELAAKDRRIRQLEAALAKAHAETVDVRNKWMQANEDVLAEKDAALAKMKKELDKAVGDKFAAERQRDEAKDKLREKNLELYEVKTQLEEERDKNRGLTAQVNKDYTNSGKSSSQSPSHKKIPNGREATGRKPGGQPGHTGHCRKRMEPDRIEELPTPEEFLDSTRFRPTGRVIRRQLIKTYMTTDVTEYTAEEFVCIATGKKVYAKFPDGVTDDVNYDGTTKAIPYILNNKCNVSIANTREFMKAASGGRLELSTGMICSLSKQFSMKTEDERNEIFRKLLAAPAMNADFTFGRVNGKTGTVIVCVADGLFLYQGKGKKGYEGVKGSPVELYGNTLISDHESVFQHYGTRHQECLVHVERYLRSSMENEPDLQWNGMMLEWIKKTIHYRNELVKTGGELDAEETGRYEKEYDEIIEKARQEYEYVPPGKYFRDGYNLYKRMAEDKKDYTLFLHDLDVSPTNNAAESAARKYKRKSSQVMCFRSTDGQKYYCDGLSVMATMEAQGEALMEGVARIFNRQKGAGKQ